MTLSPKEMRALADNIEYRYNSSKNESGSGRVMVLYHHELPVIAAALRAPAAPEEGMIDHIKTIRATCNYIHDSEATRLGAIAERCDAVLSALPSDSGEGCQMNADREEIARTLYEIQPVADRIDGASDPISWRALASFCKEYHYHQADAILALAAPARCDAPAPVAWSQRPTVFPEGDHPSYTHVSRVKTGPYPFPLYAAAPSQGDALTVPKSIQVKP